MYTVKDSRFQVYQFLNKKNPPATREGFLFLYTSTNVQLGLEKNTYLTKYFTVY